MTRVLRLGRSISYTKVQLLMLQTQTLQLNKYSKN